MILALAKSLPSVSLIIIIGSLGALTGDILMFSFVKNNITNEIAPVYQKVLGSHLKKILHTKYFNWTLPVLGAFIIASPLPDELGISLLGLSKTPPSQFLLFSYASHLVGMTLVATSSHFV